MVLRDNPDHEYESVQKTVMILIAAALNILELFIPRIPLFPWLKPGLANSITLVWIIRNGTADALLFTIIRAWITSFYFGFSLVTLTLALSGGLCATAIMGFLWKYGSRPKQRLGTIGIAIIGALFHNFGQLCAVYLFLTHNPVIFYQLPFMALASIIFGGFTGCITPLLWKVLATVEIPDGTSLRLHRLRTGNPAEPFKNIGIIIGILTALSILAVSNQIILITISFIFTFLAFFTNDRKVETLYYPLRFWFLFLFVAIADLFFSYGHRISHVPLLTDEGCLTAVTHSLRLWIWIEISLILHRLHCNRFLFAFLEKLFPNRGTTLAAGIFALDFFPDILLYAKSAECRKDLSWRTPLVALSVFITRICRQIIDRIEQENDKQQPPSS